MSVKGASREPGALLSAFAREVLCAVPPQTHSHLFLKVPGISPANIPVEEKRLLLTRSPTHSSRWGEGWSRQRCQRTVFGVEWSYAESCLLPPSPGHPGACTPSSVCCPEGVPLISEQDQGDRLNGRSPLLFAVPTKGRWPSAEMAVPVLG